MKPLKSILYSIPIATPILAGTLSTMISYDPLKSSDYAIPLSITMGFAVTAMTGSLEALIHGAFTHKKTFNNPKKP